MAKLNSNLRGNKALDFLNSKANYIVVDLLNVKL